MTCFISLLRGINVGGQNKIRMEDLRALYLGLGFENVTTYVQSGNVVFTDPESRPENLAIRIEKEIQDYFGLEVPVINRTLEDMRRIVDQKPFGISKNEWEKTTYVTFLEALPEEARVEAVERLDLNPDRFVFRGLEVYLECLNGYGRTKINNSFFEKKLRVRATTRNWNTVVALRDLAGRLTL